jgi:hypothetical protein
VQRDLLWIKMGIENHTTQYLYRYNILRKFVYNLSSGPVGIFLLFSLRLTDGFHCFLLEDISLFCSSLRFFNYLVIDSHYLKNCLQEKAVETTN